MSRLLLCLLLAGCSVAGDEPPALFARAMIVADAESRHLDFGIDADFAGPGDAPTYYVFPPGPPEVAQTYVAIDWSKQPCNVGRSLIEYRVDGREILRVDIDGTVYRNGKRWGTVDVPPAGPCPEVTP